MVMRRAWMRQMTRVSRASLLDGIDAAVVPRVAGVLPRQAVEMLQRAVGDELSLASDL